MTNKFAIAATLLLLAACGGGGTGNPTTPPTGNPTTPAPGTPGNTPQPTVPPTSNVLDARIAEAGIIRRELRPLDQTPVANVPTSGSSVFTGPAIMTVSQGAKSYSMVGDSRLKVDFGSRAVTGNVTNIQGRRANQSTFTADGRINYSNGRLAAGRNANVFTLDYAGDLKVGRDTIALDGTAVGGVYDNPASGKGRPQAIQALDGTPTSQIGQSVGVPSMTATVNRKDAVGQIYIGGKKN